MRGDGGDVGDHVFGADRDAPYFCARKLEQLGSHVGDARVGVAPEREGAAAEGAFVVVQGRGPVR